MILDRYVDVIGIREPNLDVAAGDHVPNHGVPVDDANAIRLEAAEEVVHLLVARHRVQRRHVE